MAKTKAQQPKYQLIAEGFVKQILAGHYKVGDLLPTEKALCQQFSSSRHTIRDALRFIEATGLVSRRQGAGTKVIRDTLPEKMNQFVHSINDILEHGNSTVFKLHELDTVTASEDIAQLLNGQVGEKCIHLGGVRLSPFDKRPLCYTHIYRQPNQEQLDIDLQDADIAVQTMANALHHKNIGQVEQTISASLMPKAYAQLLEYKENSACLTVVRRYFNRDVSQIILVAQSIYPGSRFSYSTTLTD